MRDLDPAARVAQERLERLMGHLEGCLWHYWDRPKRLVVIWRAERDRKGNPMLAAEAALHVVNLDDGEEVGVWPIHPSPEASASGTVRAEDAVAAAMARINRGFL